MRVTKAVSLRVLSDASQADAKDFTTARERVLHQKDENTVRLCRMLTYCRANPPARWTVSVERRGLLRLGNETTEITCISYMTNGFVFI